MPCGGANGFKLFLYVPEGLTASSLVQRLPDPFRQRHPPRTRHALNFAIFGILHDHLQSFSHHMSLFDSSL